MSLLRGVSLTTAVTFPCCLFLKLSLPAGFVGAGERRYSFASGPPHDKGFHYSLRFASDAECAVWCCGGGEAAMFVCFGASLGPQFSSYSETCLLGVGGGEAAAFVCFGALGTTAITFPCCLILR